MHFSLLSHSHGILKVSAGIGIICSLLLAQDTLAANQTDVPKKRTSLPTEELYLFSEVFHQIRRHYVNDISDEELIDLAISGMLEGLDPHSTYLDKKQYRELKESTSGEFAGIGVEVTLENGSIKIVKPIEDSPALKAGIKSGDIIIQIGDYKVTTSNLNIAVEKMRGPINSTIELIVSRGKNNKQYSFKIKRAKIKVTSVKSHFLEPGFAYMHISQFQNTTANEANEQLKAFAKTKNIRGLVLDLRNNPGGLLLAAVDLADFFLDEGLIVYTQGKDDETRENYNGTKFQLLTNTNIVVLMNDGSASASEILAGALQDRKRAVVAGTQSFGKGSVQTILSLPKERAMKLTTARYYTPSGRSIQAEGITPNIIIPNAQLQLLDQEKHLSEADLVGHLDQERPTPKTLQSTNQHLEGDYQLQHALNLLKAMQFKQ